MLISSDDIKTAKEHLEVIQAFIDGKEIEFKPDSYKGIWTQTTTPTWDFCKYKYRIKPSEPEDVNTEELFEVICYCEFMKEFEFVKQLYKDEDLENKKHLQKTGRSFVIDKDTKKIIKVINP